MLPCKPGHHRRPLGTSLFSDTLASKSDAGQISGMRDMRRLQHTNKRIEAERNYKLNSMTTELKRIQHQVEQLQHRPVSGIRPHSSHEYQKQPSTLRHAWTIPENCQSLPSLQGSASSGTSRPMSGSSTNIDRLKLKQKALKEYEIAQQNAKNFSNTFRDNATFIAESSSSSPATIHTGIEAEKPSDEDVGGHQIQQLSRRQRELKLLPPWELLFQEEVEDLSHDRKLYYNRRKSHNVPVLSINGTPSRDLNSVPRAAPSLAWYEPGVASSLIETCAVSSDRDLPNLTTDREGHSADLLQPLADGEGHKIDILHSPAKRQGRCKNHFSREQHCIEEVLGSRQVPVTDAAIISAFKQARRARYLRHRRTSASEQPLTPDQIFPEEHQKPYFTK